ncbi:MAG: signal peptidase I [Chloroflexota bacterium]
MTHTPEQTPGDAAPAPPVAQTGSRRGLGCLLEIVETLVLTLVIYLLIHNFIAQPFEVEQSSMESTIFADEYVLIDKISPRFGEYERGDIIVFQPPPGFEQQGGVPFIKRVIGLPGDTVRLENGDVFVTPPYGLPIKLSEPYLREKADGGLVDTLPRGSGETEWVVPEGEYFVMGDNRPDSQDSRSFGPIERDLIIGRAWLRYFPLDRIGFMNRPEYPGVSAGGQVRSSGR